MSCSPGAVPKTVAVAVVREMRNAEKPYWSGIGAGPCEPILGHLISYRAVLDVQFVPGELRDKDQ